ncbi:hypothetical protein Y032_0007g3550 [Ancylostoma ceylanicum]|uniref:Uncharacterized protein n=1 Tax=Ancylostoma ceylanicum TaxID=53326 RepID=A0A016VNB5_9BILA|nr:hypothetical protein Y032_0007g3550 [Ancylostoma ceylanicum]
MGRGSDPNRAMISALRKCALTVIVALFIAAFGNLVGALHRLILVAARICCIAQLDTPLVHDLVLLQVVGVYLWLFGWIFVIIERAVATVFTGSYERKCAGYTIPAILCGIVITLSSVSACVSRFRLIDNFDLFAMFVQIAGVVICLLALIAIILYNKTVYQARHDTMMQLRNRYQLDENIRGSRYLIPVAANNVLTKAAGAPHIVVPVCERLPTFGRRHTLVTLLYPWLRTSPLSRASGASVQSLNLTIPVSIILLTSQSSSLTNQRISIHIHTHLQTHRAVYVLLMAYSIYFTDIPIGHDTTHLSHAYDLLFAYERIFFVLALTIRSEKFDHFLKRKKRITNAIHNQETAVSSHFTNLKTLWA